MSPRVLLMILTGLAVTSTTAEIVSVDVSEWARTGTGVTPSGWTVTNIDEYADGSAKIKEEDDRVVSPLYHGVITQLVMSVKASSAKAQRFLTAVPDVSNIGARSLTVRAVEAYTNQVFIWNPEEGVRRFRLQNLGDYVSGWAVRSLDVYVDRIEAPQDLREVSDFRDAVSVAWTPDSRAVSNEFELCRIMTILPEYNLLRDWDFTSLTNTAGNPKSFLELNPPDGLRDVEGMTIGLQGEDGGHLQIGNTKTGGVMRLSLPMASGRKAVMNLLRSEKEKYKNFSAVIAVVGTDGQTNECARIVLSPESVTSIVALADEAKTLLLISERDYNRIRVEDVKIVTDYVPGYVTTNEIVRLQAAQNARTIKDLEPGDFIWRVRSFDRIGVVSAWSPYQKVTLRADAPRAPTSGFAVIIR